MLLTDAHHLLTVALRAPRQRTMGAKPVIELEADVARAILRAVEAAQAEIDIYVVQWEPSREVPLGPRPQGGRA